MPHSQSMSIKPYPRMVGQFGPLDISSALLQGITVVESAMLYVGGHRGTSASAAGRAPTAARAAAATQSDGIF